ncbi:MAG: hypothetical protein KO318_05140 [Methanobacterium sp.]|uniref:Ig-like domain-containing protein n=1 Tax=Methanobacterium sp. TaxID=2164 RepID=UPI00258D857D|nr:Ig-like domain-containing protein [Methanobacterium sp.]MCC7559800.1 hypothetical protein [Methanobacterium sp.]
MDNTPPTLNPTINQTLLKSGDKITITTTTADNDTQSVKAYIQDDTYQLTKNPNNTWNMEYTTPQIGDGVYSILLIAQDLVGNTNHTPLTFTVDNTPPVINPEIIPEAGKPGETINITANASADTQSVVAIIGTQRINLTFTNGIWTTNYTIPLDSTFDIHTIRIEGTDTVGNIGKNTASYEILDPNPIPSWLEDLINPDTPNPGNKPGLITNTGPGNNGGPNKPGSGTIGGNNQLYRDQMYIRKTLTYTPTTDPNTNTTTTPPEMPGWEIDTSVIEQLLLAACLVSGGLAFAYLSDTNMKSKIAKYIVDKGAGTNFVFRPQDVALFALDVVCFLVSPDLFSWVMIVYQTLAFSNL